MSAQTAATPAETEPGPGWSGNRLRSLRQAAKMTVAAASRRCGVKPLIWRSWERGDRHPKTLDLPRVALAVCATVADLFGEAA